MTRYSSVKEYGFNLDGRFSQGNAGNRLIRKSRR